MLQAQAALLQERGDMDTAIAEYEAALDDDARLRRERAAALGPLNRLLDLDLLALRQVDACRAAHARQVGNRQHSPRMRPGWCQRCVDEGVILRPSSAPQYTAQPAATSTRPLRAAASSLAADSSNRRLGARLLPRPTRAPPQISSPTPDVISLRA